MLPRTAFVALTSALLASPGHTLLIGTQSQAASAEEGLQAAANQSSEAAANQSLLVATNLSGEAVQLAGSTNEDPRKANLKKAMAALQKAYGGEQNFSGVADGMCGRCVRQEDQDLIMKVNNEQNWSAGIYGEIKPWSVAALLQQLHAGPGQRYYDLGSGTGKTPAVAARGFGMEGMGVELSRDRHEAGCQALQRLREAGGQASGHVTLARGSFFDFNVSDADIVFIDSVEYTSSMMGRLAEVCQGLRRGAKIVSFLQLPGLEAQELPAFTVEGTWGGKTKYRIWEKTSEPKPVQTLAEVSTAPDRCSA